jgi:tetratricopeptide (TPR) repeat protein
LQDLTITSLFFASFCFTLLILGTFILRFRLLNYRRIQANKYLKILSKRDLPFFYSTHAIIAESRNKFFHQPHKKETVLHRAAIKSLALSAPLIRNAVQKHPQNTTLLLLDAEVCLLLNKQTDFLHLIEQINLSAFCPAHIKAKYLLLTAKAELYQTDMLSASSHASRALKIYQRLGYAYEEAECYQTLAQIYRISGVFDVAFTMLKEAKKLYKELKLFAKTAETEAYFGLTEIGRENYKPAAEYLQSAEKICLKHYLTPVQHCLCQRALSGKNGSWPHRRQPAGHRSFQQWAGPFLE